MDKFRRRLEEFMRGRYGIDQFCQFLMITALVMLVLGSLFRMGVFHFLAIAALGYLYFRALSRNIYRRQAENQRYLAEKERLRFRIQSWKVQLGLRRTHKYFKCKSCGKKLRVPRGKGKIEVTCPHCGEKFTMKS
ncbi:MAG: hypothetical protein Q4B57_02455 [Eubacteriales bacterium]|nr:hypothetical protein [Eubacteriales bacterium]